MSNLVLPWLLTLPWSKVFGYIGMGFVMGSFLTKDMKTLRILNMVGCVVFLVHGYVIQDPATAITNGALLTINTFRLAA